MQSQRPKVLMVGPDVGAIGGRGSVAMTLADGCERSGRFDVQLLNSGGGNGRKGWRDWPAALRTAATAEADLVHLQLHDRAPLALASLERALRQPALDDHAHALGERFAAVHNAELLHAVDHRLLRRQRGFGVELGDQFGFL